MDKNNGKTIKRCDKCAKATNHTISYNGMNVCVGCYQEFYQGLRGVE